jgi:hypothetical protein
VLTGPGLDLNLAIRTHAFSWVFVTTSDGARLSGPAFASRPSDLLNEPQLSESHHD